MPKSSIVQVIGVVGFAAMLLILPGCYKAGPPTGPVLVFEVDPQAAPNPALINMDKVAEVVNRRLNPGYFGKLAVCTRKGRPPTGDCPV